MQSYIISEEYFENKTFFLKNKRTLQSIMKIKLIVVGKTQNKHLQALCDDYQSRIGHYLPFEYEVQPELKNTKSVSMLQQKELEGAELLTRFKPGDYIVLLDEHGREMRSVELADYIGKKANSGLRRLVLVVGGPYGFSEDVYKAAQEKISLSKLTFSHQMIRLLLLEQIYRALTIIKGEPYHHE